MYLGLKNNKPVGWSEEPKEGYIEVPQAQYDFASLNSNCIWNGTELVNPEPEVYVPYVPTYQELRAAEYPPMADYLDGIVKLSSGNDIMIVEGQAQVDKYFADCLAVKAKYPKV